MDLDFSPSILDTPSLTTPNINAHPVIFKSSYTNNNTTTTTMDVNNDSQTSTSNPPSIATTTTSTDESLVISSADIKLSKIEYDLKQSFSQPRKPTESPFQKIAEAGVLTMAKNVSISLTNDDGIPFEIPSTAEVMNVIESFAKNLSKDNNERDATTITTTTLATENHRLDSSPTQIMGVIVSPKKKLLIRSQSHTEPSSPPLNQTQNEESSIEDNRFQRLQDLPLNDSNTQLDVHIKPSYSIQTLQPPPIIIANKRTYQQAMTGLSIPKANSMLIPQHEVTSTGQSLTVKRQKTAPMPVNIRSSTNDDQFGGDDQRKKQIRDSNREAARRCRERRRNYIEQLEGNLEQCKAQMKQLNEKLSRAERENTQLRAIITEAKIFHPSTRLSSNESLGDYINIISTTTNGMELSSEANDGHTLQRNFVQRNTR